MLEEGVGPDLDHLGKLWMQRIKEICFLAKLNQPKEHSYCFKGKFGNHSEYLGHLLADMQYLPSRYPDAVW